MHARLRRRRGDAGADRRPEAGDLLVPRRRRVRLSQRAAWCGREGTLRRNWRSDQALIDAYDALFAGAQLGHEGIVYRPVARPPTPTRSRGWSARRCRTAARAHPARAPTASSPLTDATACAQGARRRSLHRPRPGRRRRRAPVVRPRDRRRAAGTAPRPARDAARRPHRGARPRQQARRARARRARARRRAGGDQRRRQRLRDPAAQEWLRLLEALERPTARRPGLAGRAHLVPRLERRRGRVGDEDEWEELHLKLHRWAALLRDRGVAALSRRSAARDGVPGRVLARPSAASAS